MVEIRKTILIVEDDEGIAEMLDAYFRVQGYTTTTVNWGKDAIQSCRRKRPDLIILDIRLPDIDGFEVARQLREARRTQDIPIIFLTEKRSRLDILQGLELGADDYITKPFDIQELRLRVRNVIDRTSHRVINNPVTGLPQGILVDEKLSDCLLGNNLVLLAITLKHMDHFREVYGFIAADDVLRAVSMMMVNTIQELGTASDFIGHLELDTFIVVTTLESLKNIQERIEDRLVQSLAFFYPLQEQPGKLIQPVKQLDLKIKVVNLRDRSFPNIQVLKENLFDS